MSVDAEAASTLIRFAAEWDDASIPEGIIDEAKRSLLNMLAVAIAGSADPAIARSRAVLGAFAGPPATAILGRVERTDAPTAAFLNAASANVFDFDDTHIPTIIHPTAPVAPVLLALAERGPVSGNALLSALAVGIDVACRIGLAISPDHYNRGWHITATCGVFGAAAAAGRVLGLTSEQMGWAFGIAAGQSSGLVETLGTHAKSIAVGNAARNGLLAALLAQGGISGPASPLDGERGLLRLHTDTPQWAALSDGLGHRWELSNNTYKPYPCAVVLNAVIDACLALRQAANFDSKAIAAIRISGHRLLLDRTNRPEVASGRLSQVSAQHAAAATLLRGSPGLVQFSDAEVAASDVSALRALVTMTVDDSLPVGGAEVAISLKDGRRVTHTVVSPRGSLEAPLTRQDLEDKFHALAAPTLDRAQRQRLIDAVWTLDTAPDAAVVTGLAVPSRTSNEV